jgi:hypothetical protein
MKINEQRAMKEIHDIREKLHAETQQLSPEEKTRLTNRIGADLAEKHNLKIKQKV